MCQFAAALGLVRTWSSVLTIYLQINDFLGCPVTARGKLEGLCTAEVGGSNPTRSTTYLQVFCALRASTSPA